MDAIDRGAEAEITTEAEDEIEADVGDIKTTPGSAEPPMTQIHVQRFPNEMLPFLTSVKFRSQNFTISVTQYLHQKLCLSLSYHFYLRCPRY